MNGIEGIRAANIEEAIACFGKLLKSVPARLIPKIGQWLKTIWELPIVTNQGGEYRRGDRLFWEH